MLSDNQAILYFGLAVEFPPEYVLTIQPRSSFTQKGWIMANSPGQVDSDYRGELQMRVEAIPTGFGHNTLLYPPLPFSPGDRCAQGRLEPVIDVEFEEVGTLETTERAGGFGSTGA